MLRVIISILALAGYAPALLARSVEKAIIADTSESISMAPTLYGIEKGYYREQVKKEPGVKKQVAANELVDFGILREAAKDIDGKS